MNVTDKIQVFRKGGDGEALDAVVAGPVGDTVPATVRDPSRNAGGFRAAVHIGEDNAADGEYWCGEPAKPAAKKAKKGKKAKDAELPLENPPEGT